jgi:hypothetical protein
VYQQTAESARRCNLSVVAPDTLPILRDWDTAQVQHAQLCIECMCFDLISMLQSMLFRCVVLQRLSYRLQDVKDWLLTAEPTPMRELASTAIDNIRDH